MHGAAECRAQRSGIGRAVMRVLQAQAQPGERRAQVVRYGVGHMGHARHELRYAVEHVVEVLLQPRKLVVPGGLGGHALVQLAAGDAGHGLVQRIDAAAELAAEEPGADQRQRQREQAGDQAGRGQRGFDVAQFAQIVAQHQHGAVGQAVGEQLRGDALATQSHRVRGCADQRQRWQCLHGQVAGEEAAIGRGEQHQLQIRVAPVLQHVADGLGRGLRALMGVLQSQALLRLLQLPFQVAVQHRGHLQIHQRQRGQHGQQHQKAEQRRQPQAGAAPQAQRLRGPRRIGSAHAPPSACRPMR